MLELPLHGRNRRVHGRNGVADAGAALVEPSEVRSDVDGWMALEVYWRDEGLGVSVCLHRSSQCVWCVSSTTVAPRSRSKPVMQVSTRRRPTC